MELNQYEEKMKKSLANLEEEYGRLLWNTNTNPTGSERICSGTENDSDSAMGCQSY